jgi:hypothetical protein
MAAGEEPGMTVTVELVCLPEDTDPREPPR